MNRPIQRLPGIPPSLVSMANNTTNTQGRPPTDTKNKTSQFISNVILPGATLPVPAAGNTFYVTVATAALSIRPRGGVFNEYEVGTGLLLALENAFDLIEVRNENAFAVVFQIFVGFDGYIDNRIYLNTTNLPTILVPTYGVPSSANSIPIADLSAQVVTDINGQEWYAIQRVGLIIANTDTGVTLLLYGANAASVADPAVAAIFPETSWQATFSGDYLLTSFGGGNLNCIVTEQYQALIKES